MKATLLNGALPGDSFVDVIGGATWFTTWWPR